MATKNYDFPEAEGLVVCGDMQWHHGKCKRQAKGGHRPRAQFKIVAI